MTRRAETQDSESPLTASPAINILVIEDEEHLAQSVARRLQEEGYTVDVALDGDEGYQQALARQYHLIILDLLLPRRDGLQILRDLRRSGNNALVLILTAKSTVDDRVDGLKTGADDYLTKPFAFSELIARVETLLRRRGIEQSTVLQLADLEVNTMSRVVRRGGKSIHLTAKEYALLELLIRNKNRILTRRSIAEQVWGYTFETGTNVVDVYINYLRNAIDEGFPMRLIHTVRGVGFILREE
jgi:DNA-binding response OmpR family regulator